MSWFSFLPEGSSSLFPEVEEGCPCPGPYAQAGDSMALLSLLQWALPFIQPPPPLKLLWTCWLDLLFSPGPSFGPG